MDLYIIYHQHSMDNKTRNICPLTTAEVELHSRMREPPGRPLSINVKESHRCL